jgi:hypothetical protein
LLEEEVAIGREVTGEIRAGRPGGSEATRRKRPLARVIVESPSPANGIMIARLSFEVIVYPTYSCFLDRSTDNSPEQRIVGAQSGSRMKKCHD